MSDAPIAIDSLRLVDFCGETLRWSTAPSGQPDRRRIVTLPVHILGHPADMDPIIEVAREFGLPVVETPVSLETPTRGGGEARRATCGVSFIGNKLITCGGGGMVDTAY
jgi:perosamine synthetase